MAETFNRVSTNLSTTLLTEVYQAPSSNAADRAIVLSCMVSNTDTLTVPTVSVYVANSSNTILSTIILDLTVPLASSIDLIINKLVLKSGDKLLMEPSSGILDVTVSALEVTV